MALASRLLKHRIATGLLGLLTILYIRLIWRLGRWEIENEEIPQNFIDEKLPFIACFWHGRMLMIPRAWVYDAPINILISEHRDGLFISKILRYLGIGTISGSSSHGGREGLLAMVRALKRGEYVGITPDGPKGPRMRVSTGTVVAAKLSGAALVPISYGATKRKVFRSWDRFVFPLPFSNGVVRIGTPIFIQPDASVIELEVYRKRLECDLIELTQGVDKDLGTEKIEPAADISRVQNPTPDDPT